MSNGTSYIPLIEKWEKYLETTSEPSIEGFSAWVLMHQPKPAEALVSDSFDQYFELNAHNSGHEIHTARAGYFIGRLYKYVKFYTKPVFARVGLGNLDEFGLLGALDEKGESSKKDLITDNLIEFTTGMDILKRLQSHGLIKEKTNKHDKREKLVSITAKGKRTLYHTYASFAQLPDVLADLHTNQRESLVKTLSHLDKFHKKQVEKMS